MGLADADQKEDWVEHRLLDGSPVSCMLLILVSSSNIQSSATAMSIARIPILRAGNQGGSPDLTYNLVMTYVFTVLEPMLAIICACLPVMQGLFIKGMAGGFGISSLRSLLRSNKGDSTQGSKQSWSKIQASGHSASANVSAKSVDEHSMEVPLRDVEQGYYEMSNPPMKKNVTPGIAQ